MKKNAIRVRYSDFWPGFRPERLRLHKVLSEVYDLVEAKDPDYLIDGGLGYRHLNFNCIKILVLGENLVPDFNDFDYATGFDFLTFGDRYVSIPSYMPYDSYRSLYSRKAPSLVHEDPAHYDRMTVEFFTSIFERPLDQAKRLNAYGHRPSAAGRQSRFCWHASARATHFGSPTISRMGRFARSADI